jgi:hypothetical protein
MVVGTHWTAWFSWPVLFRALVCIGLVGLGITAIVRREIPMVNRYWGDNDPPPLLGPRAVAGGISLIVCGVLIATLDYWWPLINGLLS